MESLTESLRAIAPKTARRFLQVDFRQPALRAGKVVVGGDVVEVVKNMLHLLSPVAKSISPPVQEPFMYWQPSPNLSLSPRMICLLTQVDFKVHQQPTMASYSCGHTRIYTVSVNSIVARFSCMIVFDL